MVTKEQNKKAKKEKPGTATNGVSEFNGKKFRYEIPFRAETELYYFDYVEADRVIRFFEENLTHTEGALAGQPFILEPWQRTILENVFGWKKKKNGKRRYRKLYLEVPRKNGKTTFGAGIALYLTCADREMGAKIISAASSKEQAEIVFEIAKKMIENSPKLTEMTGVFADSIAYYKLGNTYRVISADAKGKHGKNLHGILVDELHEQTTRTLVDTLTSSRGARLQPLEVYMTTAGHDRTSVCWEKHQYAIGILNGTIQDDTFYPVVYSADESEDWTKPATWEKANPNLYKSIQIEFLQEECNIALNLPAYENTFRRLYLNQWTEQASRMIQMHIWAANNKTFTDSDVAGMECYGGLDLASTEDIAAFMLLFPIKDEIYIKSHFFVPEATMPSRYKKNQLANYPEWAKRGFLTATEGDVIDYDVIEDVILDAKKRYKIKGIGYDPWNAVQLSTKLDKKGIIMEPFNQSFKSLNAPTKELLKRIKALGVRHNNNPVLNWMAGNVAAITDTPNALDKNLLDMNIRPSKKMSSEKIDGIMGIVFALGTMLLGTDKSKSVYEERGLLMI